MNLSQQGSLNIAMRKKETERIEHENRKFAKRLYEKDAFFSKAELDESYQEHKKMLNNLRKIEPCPKTPP